MELGPNSYDITVERGCLQRADALLNLDRRVLIVTDRGVPRQYAETLAARCKEPVVAVVAPGEGNKTMETVTGLCRTMLEHRFSRGDCVAAVGGGMVGDLAGFAAACFMRGVDFYNLPTTLLSQVDSSIGGKTGVNLDGVKNIVGAFWQPRGVLIDPDTLDTLPPRLWAEGMAEYVKMALTLDGELFAALQREDPRQDMTRTLERALGLKKNVVERDEREAGPRKLLNFGHTIGHALEAAEGYGHLTHGEAVAIGMAAILRWQLCRGDDAADALARLLPLLAQYDLPAALPCGGQTLADCLRHDKKCEGDSLHLVLLRTVGEAYVERVPLAALVEGLS